MISTGPQQEEAAPAMSVAGSGRKVADEGNVVALRYDEINSAAAVIHNQIDGANAPLNVRIL